MRSYTEIGAHSIWRAERSALAADALRQSGHLRLRVYGESMLPALWPGDIVEIESCSLSDIRPGQIVLALRDGQFFLHRLHTKIVENGFVLRGDSMPGRDPAFPVEALLGRMVTPTASAGWLSAKCSRLLGLMLCRCRPARRLVLKVHSRKTAPANWLGNWESGTDINPAESSA